MNEKKYTVMLVEKITNLLKNTYNDFYVIHHKYKDKDLLLLETNNICYHLADISLAIHTPDLDVNKTSKTIVDNFLQQMKNWKNTSMDVSKSENIELKVVNYEQYKHFLAIVPHVRFLDLAAYYYYPTRQDGTLIKSEPASYNATFLNNETSIFSSAKENTKKNFHISLADAEHSYLDITVYLENLQQYVFSPDEKVTAVHIDKENNVGTFLLFDEIWEHIANHYQSDLLIVPITSAQLLALPYSKDAKQNYLNDLRESNKMLHSELSYLFLSNECYKYTKTKHEITIA